MSITSGEGQSMSVKSPVAEVSVLATPGDTSALVWPQMCCCCGSTTALLDSIAIYGRIKFGGANATFYIPYCRRCQSHHGWAGQRAGQSAAKVLVIGVAILSVSFLYGMLNEGLVAFFLQVLVVVGSVAWGGRTYFVARAEIKKGITPTCSGVETPAVFFWTAQDGRWRFRFYSRAYAEQFAAVNPGGSITELF